MVYSPLVWRDLSASPLSGPNMQHLDDGVLDASTRATNLESITPAYNYTGPLRSWYVALANRDYAPADILCIGDSITEGYSVTVKNRRWVERLQNQLRLRYPVAGVAGGEGYIAASDIGTITYSNGWTVTGATANDNLYGFGHRSIKLSTPDGAITRTVSGTTVRVAHTKGSGQGMFSVFLDGSGTPAVTVDNSAGSLTTGAFVDVNLGSRGSHTVKIAWASGGFCYINGIWVYDQDETSGIRVTDSGQGASRITTWANPVSPFFPGCVTGLQPALCIIELGVNDYAGLVDPTTLPGYYTALMNQVKAACTIVPAFILLVPQITEIVQTYPWSAYAAMMAGVVAGRTDAALIDIRLRFPQPGASDPWGLTVADHVHPTDKGHAVIADVLTHELSAR